MKTKYAKRIRKYLYQCPPCRTKLDKFDLTDDSYVCPKCGVLYAINLEKLECIVVGQVLTGNLGEKK